MPPEDETRPATLRPDRSEDPTDYGTDRSYVPPIVGKEQGVSVTARARAEWFAHKLKAHADESGGRVSAPMLVRDKTDSTSYGEDEATTARRYKYEPDLEGQQLYDRWQILESDNKQFIREAGAGAGRSYVDTEGDKQDEVTRQFKDFLARAKGTYDLMDSEQKYGMNADDQNIQNMAAARAGVADIGMFPVYGHRLGPGLSSTIRPSLPNYLSPDYRMNQAVGLGGPEGFDNANYDENGMPMYADGTDPAMANIPPELLAMVGKPMGVPLSSDFQPRDWPWGRIA